MIGQEHIQETLQKQIENGTFPRFVILVGPKGSGRKLLANQIAKWMTSTIITEGTSVADIRTMIENSHKLRISCIHLIPDADSMSLQARNALLKVTEEPPNNAYFIMTLEDEYNTLDTIRSRGAVYHMDRYLPNDIRDYVKSIKVKVDDELMSIYEGICETPGEVSILDSVGVKDFYNYVTKVVDNITNTSEANAFKIADKVALKEDADGYDLKLFWKAFIRVCSERLRSADYSNKDKVLYCDGILITSKYVEQLRNKSINKQMSMDTWILEVRQAWQVWM